MKSLLKGLLAALTIFSSSAVLADEPLKTVDYVDVQQYLGKWYEIARLPQFSQDRCTAVTAEYSLNEDRSVKVFNSCKIDDPINGRLRTITGKAVAIDETNSKLDVTFPSVGGTGKYWIIELDAQSYQWAMVGEPSRRSLFILSRVPTLDEALLEQLKQLAIEKHGYNLDNLLRTQQPAE